jgi:hypothetical protein
LVLGALFALLGACSRGTSTADSPPSASALATGIPPAASGARLQTPEPAASLADLDAGGLVITPAVPGPPVRLHPRVHDDGATLSNEGLPPEVVQRIVRQHFGRLRFCFAHGLESNPSLAGKLRVRFVIGADGAVGSATDAGSTIPDRTVVECLRHSFELMSFPVPSAGKLAVTYSVTFAPAEP